MRIEGVDHVEFYVGDAEQFAFYLCTAFGFRLCGQAGPETGLTDQRSLLLRQGGIQLLLTSALTPQHPAAQYVSRHGDGVASIAFEVDDAAEAFARTVSLGAVPVERPAVYEAGQDRVVTATVLGFGDVSHRFVERSGDREVFLPGAMDMFAPDPEQVENLLTLVDHAAICVPAGELGRTVEFYQRVFGFSQIFEEFIEVGEQAMDSKVVQSPSGKVTFTVIEPVTDRNPGQIDAFLSRHGGAGVQHLALLGDDIVGAVRTLEERGVRFLETPEAYYSELEQRLGRPELAIDDLRSTNVLVDQDHWGQVFQIFTQSMHVRRTFFWEVIDRHGARTFGSGNIKALYAAVARERTTA
ncbi:4-hydroxyphenylpyruvate dioxygenase [Streptacidiphilus sp. PB12-B1b]|uniref:4-hydroxyphenylpyruvate dioxygenase n=1 Tax=Streptacidiphilus sp. PB12-B1b TaxID=2705012 RepID=UPI0015FDC927|nr:4-hydroxyphenylpyruvate dioxygenase [Streptacidiphilus sp. PB12-B1b]QMU75760.1 4-hydroxyphenylpyruvate dioxygenase [Streptacidiphilus sp. PB12-B1b]